MGFAALYIPMLLTNWGSSAIFEVQMQYI